jgi:hypothetical protein
MEYVPSLFGDAESELEGHQYAGWQAPVPVSAEPALIPRPQRALGLVCDAFQDLVC